MGSRRPLVAANWKMYKTRAQARAFMEEFLPLVPVPGVEVVICPAFPAIGTVVEAAAGHPVAVGAQDVHWEEEGAFTGEVSPGMLAEAGCRYVIVGHSERRRLFGETDEQVGRKVRAVLARGLVPILCVGETLEEREKGLTREVVGRQLEAALGGLGRVPGTPGEAGPAGGAPAGAGAAEVPPSGAGLVVAYEPVWAIGTGRNAEPADAAAVTAFIRGALERHLGREAAERTRVLYGGSVKPANIAGFAARPEIDGALVGGASLEARSFAAIAAAFSGRGGA